MCLIDTKRFRFTFKRIPIQKVVVRDTNESPYLKYKLKHRNCTILGFPKTCNNMSGRHYMFEKGFFHACRVDTIIPINYVTYKVVKGYIPAFTRYAIGCNGDICARRMILNL